jgi:hypothetical protein
VEPEIEDFDVFRPVKVRPAVKCSALTGPGGRQLFVVVTDDKQGRTGAAGVNIRRPPMF